MDDSDVPEYVRKDRMWVHWVVYNIDPSTAQIEENAKPFGTLGKNTSGESRYMGPFPARQIESIDTSSNSML